MINVDWCTVIVSIISSSITVQIIMKINMKKLNKMLQNFRYDVIDTCTTEVSNYVNLVVKKFK